MQRTIVDVHQHLFRGNDADAMARQCRRLGIEKAVLQGLPPGREPGNNELVLAAARKYPDLFIPFAGFDLDRMGPEEVNRLRAQGFAGLKFIGPSRAYNDASYFPVYARAAELGLRALFHLGIVANLPPWNDCDSGLMRPIHLDHIARSFPEFTIIGAHLGNPWYEEAAMACRWNPNLFFDISGSTLKYRSPEYIGGLLWWTPDTQYRSPDRRHAWEKILFGSDVSADMIEDVIHDYEHLMSVLKLSPEFQENVWHGNAARVLGLSGKSAES